MNRFFSFLVVVLICFLGFAQNSFTDVSNLEQVPVRNNGPKLVVGIVVDQMRYDYLTRFDAKYGDGGFKRLINGGFNCKNHHFNYIPTYTGPGHASIYTGTTPKFHGIISNNWFDKKGNRSVNCVSDNYVRSIGTSTNVGQMSPQRLLTTSFADENRLFTQFRGKTIGVSLKDRGAILPAGHTANAAYWFQGKDEGHFISSSFYMETLPNWVSEFNESDVAESYFKSWNTLKDINTYTESGSDQNQFEGGFYGKELTVFPYDLEKLKNMNDGFDILRSTPYGNNLLTDFVLAAIKGENLGKDEYTDILAISYSSTDYIGHNFGVNSKEIEDTYLRLDLEIERLLNELDAAVGKDHYTVFLTSDHGVVNVPAFLQSRKIPAGYIDYNSVRRRSNALNNISMQKLTSFLVSQYGSTEIIKNISNNQIFLNKEKIKENELDLETVQKEIANEVSTYDEVFNAYSGFDMMNNNYTDGIERLLQNGFNSKRSGDVLISHSPAYISSGKTGTTHGSGYNYDTHVPLVFYGNGINQGSTVKYTRVVDIAPTISALLGISFPNAATGQPLDFVLD